MVRVEKCCCCELKTGTLIIATLGWIFTLVKIFALIGAVGDQNSNKPHPDLDRNNPFDTLELDQSISSSTLGYRIGYAVVSFVVCILLVVGVYKKSSIYFIPFLIVECLECIGVSVITVVIFVFIFLSPHPANIVFGILFVVLVGFTILSWYLWTVVYSYFHVVKNETDAVPTGGNVYYSPTSTQPPPYEKDRTQIA